jgi:tRNA(Ile)-lysidine synthase
VPRASVSASNAKRSAEPDLTGPAAALDDAGFAASMARLGPFEAAPLLAVGVSGGSDSLALLILAERWVRARSGRVVALTVDHRLRADSTAEARDVARLCAARGIAHATLPVPVGGGNIEAAAREERYRALAEWCRTAGCLHLLVAHHREDQAETLLLRLARGSGVDGLAAMPAVRELGPCRLLRPLLDVSRASLRAALAASGLASAADDPMNRDDRFARVRLRRLAPLLAAEGLSADRLGATAVRLGAAREALEHAAAELLARAAQIDPAGHCSLDPIFTEAAREVALRALASVLVAIGGNAYPPRYERLLRAFEGLAGVPLHGRTLAGCRLVPWRGRILICREPQATAPPLLLVPGQGQVWDRRFLVTLVAGAPQGLSIGKLGRERLPAAARIVPGPARPALPALRRGTTLIGLPSLGFPQPGEGGEVILASFAFRPLRGLSSASFTVV